MNLQTHNVVVSGATLHVIRDATAEQRAERGPEQQRAGDEPLIGGREMQLAAHVQQGAVDDASVISKQQATEG
jgi:hypothetical protein